MYTYTFEAFTTFCELQIDIIDKAIADDLASDILSQTKRLQECYSYFKESSELYKINHRRTNSLHVSDEFAGLIQLALFYNKVTNGAFDIALAGTLKEFRDDTTKLLPFASSSCIQIDGNSLTFSNDFTKIDFGGLVKEYAVDQSALMLKQAGVKSGLVNFGGDVATFGTYNKKPWSIGIQDPLDSLENIAVIELNENSLCTSGHSKRFQKINEKNFSHIVSLKHNDHQQISVLAPTTVDAGVWSTALLVDPSLELPSHMKIVNLV